MDRHNFAIFLAPLLLLGLAPALFPCDIHFEFQQARVAKGKDIPLILFVRLEHSRCHLAIEDTEIEVSGCEIRNRGEWKQMAGNLFSLELTVRLTTARGEVNAWRECGKKGVSQAVAKLKPQA